MAHVFISYKHEDGDFAAVLKHKIEEAGFEVWWDADLRAGDDWRESIDQAIREAFACVVIMTPAAKASEYVTYEWACAWGAGVKVIPIMLVRTPLHPRLEALQHLDFTVRASRPWNALIDLLIQAEDDTPGTSVPKVKWKTLPVLKKAIEGLDSPLSEQRKEAIDSLVQMMPDPQAQEALIAALRHPNRTVRESIARSIGELRITDAIAALIETLQQDKVPSVRRAAAQALGWIGNKNAMEDLSNSLENDEDEQVRWASAQALGLIGDASAVPVLKKALTDEFGGVRWAAAEALGLIGDPSSVPELEKALNRNDRDVHNAALVALEKIGTAPALEAVRKYQEQASSINKRQARQIGTIDDQ